MKSEKGIVEIRCSCHRPHVVGGIEYATCGNSLGAIDVTHENLCYFRCPVCGFWRVIVDSDGEITMFKINKKEYIEFEKSWRIVKNG